MNNRMQAQHSLRATAPWYTVTINTVWHCDKPFHRVYTEDISQSFHRVKTLATFGGCWGFTAESVESGAEGEKHSAPDGAWLWITVCKRSTAYGLQHRVFISTQNYTSISIQKYTILNRFDGQLKPKKDRRSGKEWKSQIVEKSWSPFSSWIVE